MRQIRWKKNRSISLIHLKSSKVLILNVLWTVLKFCLIFLSLIVTHLNVGNDFTFCLILFVIPYHTLKCEMNQQKNSLHLFFLFTPIKYDQLTIQKKTLPPFFDLNQSTIIGMTKVEVERLIPLLKNFFEDAKGKVHWFQLITDSI